MPAPANTSPKRSHHAKREAWATPKQGIDALLLPGALLRIDTVSRIVGLSPSTIYKYEKAGKFPAAVRLSARVTRWRSEDIRAWLEKVGLPAGKANA